MWFVALKFASALHAGLASRAVKSPGVWYAAAACSVASRSPALSCAAFCSAALWQATAGDKEARHRFCERLKQRPLQFVVTTPATAAFVGWLTNYVGVQMLFYPLKWRGVDLGVPRLPCSSVGDLPPFGWFGWQGIVPAKAPRMARDLVRVVAGRLVSVDDALKRLDPKKIADFIDVPLVARKTAKQFSGAAPLAWEALSEEPRQAVRAHGRRLALGVAADVRNFGSRSLDLQGLCVRELSGPNVKALVDLFQRVGKTELRLLVDSGLVVGLFLGLIQSCLSLTLAPQFGGAPVNGTEHPAVALAGSGVVGAVTNWIALLWIFKPILPTRVLGLFTLQGCFLRRQPDVARDFAKFFVQRILTSRKLLDDLVFSGPKSHLFRPRLSKRVAACAAGVAVETMPPALSPIATDPAFIDSVTTQLTHELKTSLPDELYAYADSALDLENQIASKMTAMAPKDFERLLHPIFEEDEITLIAVGAVLGVFATWLQMKLGDWWTLWRARRADKIAVSGD